MTRPRFTRRLRPACLPAAVFAIAAIVGLAGCKDEKKATSPQAASGAATQRMREAAQQNIQATAPVSATVKFRGVVVYSQAAEQHVAVCGQVSPFADDPNIFVPFVSVVTAQPHGDATEYQFDQRIGISTSEASRVYSAIVTYCYEDGGPSPSPIRGVASTPPLPDSVPDPLAHNAQHPATVGPVGKSATAMTPGAAPTEASGTVTMRQNGNLRTDPHGSPIRVVSQGTSFKVFGQAPGGWLQVGDTAPVGWVHESMLDRR